MNDRFIHDAYTKKAMELVREGQSLFITGKAGTGKTCLLREIVRDRKHKNIAISAPTGVAAKNAGGVTLHSLLGLPISIYIPGHKLQGLYKLHSSEQEVIRKLDILIIDEVSMVRCDVMDMADDVLRHYRNNDKPFGGVQVILFGDLRQLMPVADEEDWGKLGKFYKSPYFFSSEVISHMDMPMLELVKVHRQDERKFIDLLNDVRDGRLTPAEQDTLNKRYFKDFEAGSKSQYIRITTHVRKADSYNRKKLEDIDNTEYEYKANILDFFPKAEFPTDYVIRLRRGARVMFLANDNVSNLYCNGTLGTVTKLSAESISVKTDDGTEIDVPRRSWDFYRYEINKIRKEVERIKVGTFIQFPLQLAWCITIHKCQGLTFDNVIIDAGKSFAPGMVYVALSRCRKLNGIVLVSKISPKVVMIDPIVVEYTQLVRRIWPEENYDVIDAEEEKSICEYLEKYEYKAVGHVFKAHWDDCLYDSWIDTKNSMHLDRLVLRDGKLDRLTVGEYECNSRPFNLLFLRYYDNIKDLDYKSKFNSIIRCYNLANEDDDSSQSYSYLGMENPVERESNNGDKWNSSTRTNRFSYRKSENSVIVENDTDIMYPVVCKVAEYSDLGKLLLCCKDAKIVWKNTKYLGVCIESQEYIAVTYLLADGKGSDETARSIADKYYSINGKDIIKKTFDEIPESRKNLRPSVIKSNPPVSSVSKKVKTSYVKKRRYKPDSTQAKILNELQSGLPMKARTIANNIGCVLGEVNSLLYGELKNNELVEKEGLLWRLKK